MFTLARPPHSGNSCWATDLLRIKYSHMFIEGRLHFVKFETSRVEDAIAFIEAKGLHRFQGKGGQKEMRVITTGEGGQCGRDNHHDSVAL